MLTTKLDTRGLTCEATRRERQACNASGGKCGRARRLRAHEHGYNIPFVLSETNDDPHVENNSHCLQEAARAYPDMSFYHATIERQQSYFQQVFATRSLERWFDVFLGGRRDYGVAMNKLFLMSLSLGADGIHRRDSDTQLASDGLGGDVPQQFPLEVELALLGRRVSEVASELEAEVLELPGDPRITVLDGNYVGEWNLAVKEFAARDMGIVHRLYEILGFDPKYVEGICAEAFPPSVAYDAADVRTLVTSMNDGLNPDCGNVAITQLQEVLPSVIGCSSLAADYFAFDIATSLGLPSVHHTRAVFHAYNAPRFDRLQKTTYWEGVCRFADYFNSYMPLYDGTLAEKLDVPRGGSVTPQHASRIAAYLRDVAGAGYMPRYLMIGP